MKSNSYLHTALLCMLMTNVGNLPTLWALGAAINLIATGFYLYREVTQ